MLKNIQEELNVRLGLTGASTLLSSTLSFSLLDSTVSDATTLYPCLLIGDNITTHATCYIVCKPVEWALARDVLGLASPVYTPHELLWGFEHTADGNEYLTTAQKSIIMAVLARAGCRVSVFQINTGDSFDIADFTTTSRLVVIEPSLQYPMVMSQ